MSENRSVNRALNDQDFDHIDHALGRPMWPLRETYRNYFATEVDSEHGRSFSASPNWQRGGTAPGGLVFFRVTDEGRRALADHLKALGRYQTFTVTFDSHDSHVVAATRSKARYEYFCQVSDCLGGMTFGAFAKATSVRRAA